MSARRAAACIVENRACSRYQLSLPVLFSWARETQHQGAGFTRDIGVDGAFVFAQMCPPAGAQVKVELVLPVPEDPHRELRLRCTGTVVRTELDWPYGRGFAVSGNFGGELYSKVARA